MRHILSSPSVAHGNSPEQVDEQAGFKSANDTMGIANKGCSKVPMHTAK